MNRPIAISLSPNTEKDDVILAIKTLFSPYKWFDFRLTERLETSFAKRFGKNYKAVAVNSGRGAEYLILKALGIGKDDEVILQAFTCVTVVNPILWVGAKPKFIDIDDSYNLDTNRLGENISEKTKAIIVQHTYGIPSDINVIKKVVRKKDKRSKISLIEDCAVSLGATYQGKKVGTLGDISFFSFGRDKIISSVFGGMILVKDKKLYEKIKNERDKLFHVSPIWLWQQLFHPIAFAAILPIYNFGCGRVTLGKLFLFLLQKSRLISKAINDDEKKGLKPKIFPQKMPGALANLALNQLNKLERFNKHRLNISKKYFALLGKTDCILPPKVTGGAWLRFPIRHKKAENLFSEAKNKGILLGDWYRGVIAPVKDFSLLGYQKGSCPRAERFSQTTINLPTYPTLTLKQVNELVKLIKRWLNTK